MTDEADPLLVGRKYGSVDRTWDRRSPTLDASGSVTLGSADSSQILIQAKRVTHYVAKVENSGDLMLMIKGLRPKLVQTVSKMEVVLTDARVIFQEQTPNTPAVRGVGHVRYPWISQVSFRPKQGFMSSPAIQLHYQQEFPIADWGTWFHHAEIEFDNAFDPGPLATDIVRRIARHHLHHGAPEAARERLVALTQVNTPPPPAKGSTADFFFPTFVHFPDGAAYVGDDHAQSEWIVTKSDAGDDAHLNEPEP